MSASTRRRFGAVLIAIGLLSGIIVALINPDVVDTKVSHGGDKAALYTVVAVHTKMDIHSLGPSFALLAVGIVCLIWPSRQPPRLTS